MNQEILATYFTNPKKYNKIGNVSAKLVPEGTKVDTVIDGKQETTNTASKNSIQVTGVSGEKYLMSKDKFTSRYSGPELSSDDQTFKATGSCYAMKWTQEKPAQFEASWGESMIIEKGDMLCSLTEIPAGDLYRIEKNVFVKTYSLA